MSLTYEVHVDWNATDWTDTPDFSEAIDNITEQFVGFHKEMDKLQTKVDKILEDAKNKDIELLFDFERNEHYTGSYVDVMNKRKEFAYMGEVVRDLEIAFERDSQYLMAYLWEKVESYYEGEEWGIENSPHYQLLEKDKERS